MLLDVTVGGRRIPGLFQVTKQSYLYSYNRQTGEPIWPMEMRPAPQSKVPGEKLSKVQPHPTKPKPYDFQGRKESDVIDYTPEIKKLALERVQKLDLLAELFEPPRHRGNAEGKGPANICPGGNGGANITGPPAGDPVAGVIFITSYDGCSPTLLQPASERDNPQMTGKTLADWVPLRGGKPPAPAAMENDPLRGFPSLFKGPVGRIVAIDVNTGEHLWVIPHGDTAQRDQDAFRDQPLMKGLTFDTNVGRRGQAAMAATSTLLLASGQTADNRPALFGIDKKTGKRVGSVAVPRLGGYGLMTYLHQGKQYVVIPVNGGYTALALP
jgi:quinoprotein glucose dehydrogenase